MTRLVLKGIAFGLGLCAGLVFGALPARAQQTEAESGFALTGTFSALTAASTEFEAAPRSGSIEDAGFRLMLYPTWKLSRHWTLYGAWQLASRPYYYSEFDTQGRGAQGNLAQGYLNYSQVWDDASVQVRAGELSSAFGSFPLHYDDRDNPLVDIPMQYAYYGAVATLSALAGAEVDVTWKRLDARAQFVNSSPANPRSIFASEQYGSWAGGAGVTIVQGLRVGASGIAGRIWIVSRLSISRSKGDRVIYRQPRSDWTSNGATDTGICAVNGRGS